MEYVDDKDDIEDSLAALDRVKNWAYEQMGSMRRPNGPGEASTMGDPSGDAQDEGAEGEQESAHDPRESDEMGDPTDDAMDQGADDASGMRHYKPPHEERRPKKELTVIATGSKVPPRKPDDAGMDEWSNDTVKKLDKFGRKQPRR